MLYFFFSHSLFQVVVRGVPLGIGDNGRATLCGGGSF